MRMRAVCVFLAIVGGCALVAEAWMGLATGHLDEAGFVLAGPAPLYVAGLIGVFRGPGRRVAFWLLAVLVVLLILGLALGFVAWMIDRLTRFDDH